LEIKPRLKYVKQQYTHSKTIHIR